MSLHVLQIPRWSRGGIFRLYGHSTKFSERLEFQDIFHVSLDRFPDQLASGES